MQSVTREMAPHVTHVVLLHDLSAHVFWYHCLLPVPVFGIKVEENTINHGKQRSLRRDLPCSDWVWWQLSLLKEMNDLPHMWILPLFTGEGLIRTGLRF